MMSLQSIIVFDLVNRPWRHQTMSQERLYACKELMKRHWDKIKSTSFSPLSIVMSKTEFLFIRFCKQREQCKLNASPKEVEHLLIQHISTLFRSLARSFE